MDEIHISRRAIGRVRGNIFIYSIVSRDVDLGRTTERKNAMTLRFACLFAPGPRTVERAWLAGSLGYERIWLSDSPAL